VKCYEHVLLMNYYVSYLIFTVSSVYFFSSAVAFHSLATPEESEEEGWSSGLYRFTCAIVLSVDLTSLESHAVRARCTTIYVIYFLTTQLSSKLDYGFDDFQY
jgi:hypothetical protein